MSVRANPTIDSPIKDLLADPIKTAEEGFPVSEIIGRSWAGSRAALAEWPEVLRVPRGPAGADTPPGLLRPFEDVTQLCGAEPVLHVRYFREPWVSQVDDYGRVTFDRRLRCRLARGSLDLRAEDPSMEFYDDALTGGAWGSLVVLEIKVEPKVPWWARTLIQRFELMQRGYSKYCYVIDHARETAEGGFRRSVAG